LTPRWPDVRVLRKGFATAARVVALAAVAIDPLLRLAWIGELPVEFCTEVRYRSR